MKKDKTGLNKSKKNTVGLGMEEERWADSTKAFLLCRLCVAALSVNNFCDNREALYGVFDGDRNVEVPYLLQCTMSDILAEELQKTKNEEEYMVNTFIVMQR